MRRSRTSCKGQVQDISTKLGILVICTDIFGTWGSSWLDGLGAAAARVVVFQRRPPTATRTPTGLVGRVRHEEAGAAHGRRFPE